MSKLLAWKVQSVPAEACREVREATTGCVVATLPQVWAVSDVAVGEPEQRQPTLRTTPKPEMAFYRKYTEALLRRYVRLSTESGRVPSLLGRSLFRANVTRYKVQSFEDVVIFCCDMEKCLVELDSQERELIKRIALQEYTQTEVAAMVGMSVRTCVRRYGQAIDHLTAVLLRLRLLEAMFGCQ